MIAVIVQQMLEQGKATTTEIGLACAKAHVLAQRVLKAKEDIRKYKEASREALDHLQGNLDAIRAECDHPAASYHADPSGNNDSHYECIVCGGIY